jgi:hypothetical protein
MPKSGASFAQDYRMKVAITAKDADFLLLFDM